MDSLNSNGQQYHQYQILHTMDSMIIQCNLSKPNIYGSSPWQAWPISSASIGLHFTDENCELYNTTVIGKY